MKGHSVVMAVLLSVSAFANPPTPDVNVVNELDSGSLKSVGDTFTVGTPSGGSQFIADEAIRIHAVDATVSSSTSDPCFLVVAAHIITAVGDSDFV
ncbi:MAG: hypothetical protein P8X82_09580, partial [Gemmatimonadales bacterium]